MDHFSLAKSAQHEVQTNKKINKQTEYQNQKVRVKVKVKISRPTLIISQSVILNHPKGAEVKHLRSCLKVFQYQPKTIMSMIPQSIKMITIKSMSTIISLTLLKISD